MGTTSRAIALPGRERRARRSVRVPFPSMEAFRFCLASDAAPFPAAPAVPAAESPSVREDGLAGFP